ncbi:PEP-CTERM sorting domain-containing protein [Aeoliella sp. SH292]|uniref:PEP-CTERM sorting domain-containing protein n=1 Tax=Aeoliella sp. SH292 TaxID=3454464 RepID=UPI003F945488
MLRRSWKLSPVWVMAILAAQAGEGRADLFGAPTTITATSEFNGDYTVTNLFDEVVTDANIGVTQYGAGGGTQWAGVGTGPFNVFMDYGSPLTGVDGFVYSQRLGGNPALDKVGRIDFWFSNTDFGGVIPGTPANASVTVTNTATPILTQYTFGGADFSGQYVAARFIAPPGGGGNIGGSEFRLSFNTPTAINPAFIVDRETGNITLTNDTASDVTFIAYEIESPDYGGLDSENWSSITGNYDSGNPGPNQVTTATWLEFTPEPFVGVLSEGVQPGSGGVTLSTGQSVNLGNSWIRTSTEDLTVRLVASDGSLITTDIVYVGDEVVDGDYSGNGSVGAEDWPLFRTGLGSAGTNLSLAQAYRLGDLDEDGDTDLRDFRAFEALYDANNGTGALAALMTSQVPEPSSFFVLLGLVGVAMVVRRHKAVACTLLGAICVLGAATADAQVFTLSSPATPTTSTANSEYNADYGVAKLFDDTTFTGADVGVKVYGGGDPQYAGVGVGPMELFFDYGSSISANYLTYAQRAGAIGNADKVGKVELWFSNTDFGGVVPATSPDADVSVTELSGVMTPYSLTGVKSGRYVAARLTINDISLDSPVNNIGGNELRLMNGPSDVVLEVNRSTGSLTIRNEGALAQSLPINGYEIRSGGSLLATWNGFENGSVGGFTPGTGTGNGWEKGDSSNSSLLVEANLLGSSTLSNTAVLPLGTGYNTAVDGQDLEFYVNTTGTAELFLPGRVVYVGGTAELFGDYNNDGTVNLADYTVWRDNLGAASLTNEDPSASPGVVNAIDYQVWKSNFGESSSGSLVGSTSVPEPSGLLLLALAGAIGVGRRWNGLAMRILGGLAIAVCCVGSTSAATPDAIYLFGDNSGPDGVENGSAGVAVGQGAGALVADFTIDHFGDPSVLTTYRDLAPVPTEPAQRPKYINTAALNYPGTNMGSVTSGVGIVFDGVDDALRGPGLGYPPDGDANFADPYANAYFTITTRLMDGWVRPTNLSGARQDVVNDSSQFGIHITANDTWGITYAGQQFDSNVVVADTLDANGWAHVQHIVKGNRATLLVNGVVELITPNTFYLNTDAEEIVFGSNLEGDGDFFTGTMDNFRLAVAGDNRGLTPAGKNYGTINLLTDNDFITANVTPGDANGDGMVKGNGTGNESVDDVTYFVNRFYDTQVLTDAAGNSVIAGDLNSITTMADFDGSGRTDLLDWIILFQNHQDSAALATVDLAALLQGGGQNAVPEPATWAILAFAVVGYGVAARGRRKS